MTKRTTAERLTQAQLEAIRERAEAAIGRHRIKAVYPDKAFDVLVEDIPALLAEVERLRGAIYEVKFMTNSGCISCEGVWGFANDVLRSETE